MKYLAATLLAAALGLATACGGDDDASDATPVIDPGDGGDYSVTLDPAAFVERIGNPYLPFLPGTRWVHEGEEDGEVERIEVVVLEETRTVMGITATVVRDTVTIDGELVEDTYDWFAQDSEGNVWYLGEESVEFEDGEAVSTAGSWEAGVDGALPGIVMLAQPAAGRAYRQESYPGEAEDMAQVLRLGASETVPFGSSEDLLVTREWNPLEPGVVEEKYYARGIGLALEVTVEGGEGRVELISYASPAAARR